jgi:hypothetical protein
MHLNNLQSFISSGRFCVFSLCARLNLKHRVDAQVPIYLMKEMFSVPFVGRLKAKSLIFISHRHRRLCNEINNLKSNKISIQVACTEAERSAFLPETESILLLAVRRHAC